MLDSKLIAIDRMYEKGRVTIDWFLGKRCNFDCSYCTSQIHDNSSPHIPIENLKYAIDSLLGHIEPNRLKISFTGGEPCIHPDFLPLCKYINERGIHQLTLISNGSQRADYYIELLQYINRCTISQHFEFTKPDSFTKKIAKIYQNMPQKKYLLVQVMFHAQHFEAVKQSVEFYKQSGIRYTLRRIRTKQKGHPLYNDYTEEMLDWFFENQPKKEYAANLSVFIEEQSGNVLKKDVNANEISGAEKNNFLGWTCWAGIDHFHIWFDGTVYRGNCHQGGALGNIVAKTFKLPTEPIVCATKLCFCAPEIMLKKVSESKFQSLVN